MVATNAGGAVYGNEISFSVRDLYTHDTVTAPLMDESRLIIPTELANNELAKLGFVDVTASPFNADKTGQQDSTVAIQTAANLARDYQMVLYFPLGTYKITDTVSCIQGYYRRQNGVVLGSKTFFCSWLGENLVNGQKSKIILAPNSAGFNDPKNPKYAIHFWTRDPNDINIKNESGAWAFSTKFSNIDIELGSGNSGAVGIRMKSAEGSGISDSYINATNGYAGISGGAGSGGSHSNITIIGGRIGMDLKETQPTPALIGITLKNQTEAAILYSGTETLMAVGLDIVSQTAGPAIKSVPVSDQYNFGPMAIIDSKISFDGAEPNTLAVLASNRANYLNNVYIKGSDKVINNSDGSYVLCNKNGWIKINEYAYESTPPIGVYKGENIQYYHSIYKDGVKYGSSIINYEINKEPPVDLVSQHLWDSNFPSWNSSSAVNVKSDPYNAKGDGYTDDTIALQKAINENEIVFLPKGFYRISSTIKLKSNTKLLGIDSYFSNIIIRDNEGYFTDPNNAKSLVETSDSNTANTIIDGIGIYVPREQPGAYALKWQSGGNSIVRRVSPRTVPFTGYGGASLSSYDNQRKHPLILITNNGGGRWYNQHQGAEITNPEYRGILVDSINGPLTFYSIGLYYARSEAVAEIRNSKHVAIFGLKGEGIKPIVKVKNSDHIRIFAYGGNAAPENNYPLFQIENVANFLLSNLVSRTRFGEPDGIAGPGRHPSLWSIIKEITPTGQNIATPIFERPVVYKRGNALAFAPISSSQSSSSAFVTGVSGGNSAPGAINPGISAQGSATTTATSTDNFSGAATITPATATTTTSNNATSTSIAPDAQHSVLNIQFIKPLKFKSECEEVKQLQKILNNLGFVIAKEGEGSKGNETNHFGSLTREAVKKFQCQHNIVCSGNEQTTGYGLLGPKTREKLNELSATTPSTSDVEGKGNGAQPVQHPMSNINTQEQIINLKQQLIELMTQVIEMLNNKSAKR